MEGEKSGLLRSSDWAKRDQDRGSMGMANADMCQGHAEVLGISKLLPPVHLELCLYSQTTA